MFVELGTSIHEGKDTSMAVITVATLVNWLEWLMQHEVATAKLSARVNCLSPSVQSAGDKYANPRGIGMIWGDDVITIEPGARAAGVVEIQEAVGDASHGQIVTIESDKKCYQALVLRTVESYVV